MSCSILEKKIKDKLTQRLEIIGRVHKIDLKEGTILDSDSVLNLEEIKNDLLSVEAEFGAGSAFRYTGDFIDTQRITVNIIPDPELVEAYLAVLNGKKNPKQDESSSKADWWRMSRDHLEAEFLDKKDDLREHVVKAAVEIKRIFKMTDTSKILYDETIVDPDLRNRLQNIKDNLLEASIENDYTTQILAFSDYLTQVNVLSENIYKVVEQLIKDDPKGSFQQINELAKISTAHKQIINELNDHFTTGLVKNELTDLIGQTKRSLDGINTVWVDSAKNHALTEYMKIYTPRSAEYVAKVERVIQGLEDQKEGKNAAVVARLEEKIEKQRKNLRDFNPSREKILATLEGAEGDISMFNSYIRSAITNPDYIISGMMELFKEAMDKMRVEQVRTENRFQTALNTYQKKSGKKIINTETAFENMLVPRIIKYYDKNTGKIEERKTLQMVNKWDPKFYTDRSNLDAKIEEQQDVLNKIKNDLVELKTDKGLINKKDSEIVDPDFLKLYDLYKKQKDIQSANYKKRKDWERDNLSSKLTDAYWKPDIDFLEVYMWKDADGNIQKSNKKPEGIEDVTYVSDYYNKYNNELNTLQNKIKLMGWANPEQSKLRNKLRSQKLDLRNKNKYDLDSIEYALADHLSEYHKIKKKFSRYELTQKGRDKFSTAYEKVLKRRADNEITEEDLQNWKNEMTTRVFSDEFKDKQAKLIEKRNRLLDSINADLQRIKEKNVSDDVWEQLKLVSNKYRDNNGIVNGQDMTEKDMQIAKNLEDKLEELKQLAESLDGTPAAIKKEKKDLYKRRSELFKFKKGLDKYSKEAQDASQSINEIDDRLEAIKKNYQPSQIVKDLLEEFAEVSTELFALSQYTETEYYRNEYNKQKNIFLQGLKIGAPPSNFIAGGKKYVKQANGAYHKFTSKGIDEGPLTGLIEDVWRRTFENKFETESQWFKDNHFETDEFVKEEDGTVNKVTVNKPYYFWRQSEPSNPDHIFNNSPSFAWNERIINDSYTDENGKVIKLINDEQLLDVDETPLPKLTSKYRTEWTGYEDKFKNDPASSEFLEFMREEFYESQRNGKFNKGNMLGDIIPSIERNFNLFDLNSSAKSKSNIKEQFLRNWTVTDQDRDEGYGNTAGELASFLPVYYTGNIDPELVSKNVFSTILKYSQSANKHKLLTEEVLPTYEATQITLKQQKNVPESETNDSIMASILNKIPDAISKKFKIKKLVDSKKSGNTRLKVLQETMNMFAYGEHNVTTGTQKVFGRETRFDKIFHNLLGFKSMTALAAFNPAWGAAAQMGNAVSAVTQQAIKASIANGNATFNFSDWGKAYKDFSTIYASQIIVDEGKTGLRSKFGQLVRMHGVFDELLNDTGDGLTKQSKRRRLISKDLLFFTKNGMETTLASTTYIAVAKSHFIKNDAGELILNKEGKPINVLDAYTINSRGDAVVREDLYDSNGNITSWSDYDYSKFRGYVQRTKRDIDGAYGSLDKSIVQRLWWGSAIFWMKKFLVPHFENMYSQKRYNFEEGTHIEGYWRNTLFSIIDLFGYMGAHDVSTWNPIGIRDAYRDYLLPEQKDAMRQAGMQVSLLMTFILITSLVFGYDDEDEERFKKMKSNYMATNWALYGMLKGRTEAESLVFPFGLDELSKLVKNPAPQLIPYYRETLKLVKNISPYDALFKEDAYLFDRYKSGNRKGNVKALVDLYKGFGGISDSKKGPTDAIKAIEYMKRL